jgi:hypothetical protein
VPNPNPTKARRAKHRQRVKNVGDIHDVRSRLWEAVEAAADVVRTAEDAATRLKGVHGVTQATTAYVKLLEAAEFESRLQALEEALGESAL